MSQNNPLIKQSIRQQQQEQTNNTHKKSVLQGTQAWGYLSPTNSNQKIHLVNNVSFLSLIDGKIEILIDDCLINQNKQNKNEVQKFRNSIRLIKSNDQNQVFIQCMDESLGIHLFNQKLKFGDIQSIQEGDILCIKSLNEFDAVSINLIFSFNKDKDDRQVKEAEEEDIREENRKLRNKINQIKQMDENFENDLNCPICLELMHNPISIIGCLHSFCGDCLSKAVYLNGNINISCPTCRSTITDVKLNSLISTFIEKHLKIYPELKKDPIYYQTKDKENQYIAIQQILKFQNQIQLQRNYHFIREEQEGVKFCSHLCSLLIMLIIYYMVTFINKRNENK